METLQKFIFINLVKKIKSKIGKENFRFLIEERLGQIILSVFASGGAKVISILFILITTPLTINYLSYERYSLWVTISSTFAFAGFADLGIGFAIVNVVSSAKGRNDWGKAHTWISSGFFLLLLISCILGAVLFFAYPHIDWPKVFNLQDPIAISEAGPSVLIFVILTLISIPLTVVQRIQLGLQKNYVNSAWQAIGYILTLIGVLIAINAKAGLPLLVGVLSGIPLLSILFNWLLLAVGKWKFLLPGLRHVSVKIMKLILISGFLFFVRQLADTIGMQSDNLVIAHILGIEYVTLYSVNSKLFTIIPMILSFVFMPLWPAYGEAYSKGDNNWIEKVFSRSIGIGFLFSFPLACTFVLFGNNLLREWVGPDISTPSILLFAFGIWMIIKSTFVSPIYVYLNGINEIGFQAICATFMGVSNIILSIYLTKTFGISGVVWGSILSHIFCIVVPSFIYIMDKKTKLAFYTNNGDC